jgi:hypothetical protein
MEEDEINGEAMMKKEISQYFPVDRTFNIPS